jgi:uncharacterized membrane protein HdeD (DUF308 family)
MSTTMPEVKSIKYAYLLGGVTALVFGLILLFRQEAALSLLMVMLGLWFLIQGAFTLFSLMIDREDIGWKLVFGILGVTAGIFVLLNPGEAADVFKGAVGVVLGVIGVMVGLTALFGGFRSKDWGAVVVGVFSLLIGILILANAAFSTALLVTLFGILLLLEGIAAIVVGVRY